MGDFNTPLIKSKKFRGSQIQNDNKLDLADFINGQGLVDFDLSGASFTWSNCRVGVDLIQVRLDRALILVEWIQHYVCSLNSIVRIGSDHFPLCLMVEPKNGPRRRFPFRFEKMWLSHPNLSSSMKYWWNVQVDGSCMFWVAKKLRHVKDKAKKWNREVFGDIFIQKSAIQEELGLIRDKVQNEGYVNDNFAKESEVLSKYHKIIAREETFWRQRSRSLWLKDGDKNTRFFHISTLKHMVANRIGHLVKNGRRIDNEDEISGVVVEFFADLMKKDTLLDSEAQNILVDIIPKVLSDNENHNIAAIPSKEEIRSVVFSFDGSKSLGPYNFPMFFFQQFWEVVGEDVSNAVKEFFGARSLLRN
ncbi:uncharacterized protein LOC131857829 [Cryptomeria japonica]|uniref:uncharacterized protein LOC131857829 n=1 Tax=Cryptomeria japonica TaxID=3369 RepID=UPI0027DA04CC|nr:uncharacterized protein LOC131857829 [Cryptomeria japonica]